MLSIITQIVNEDPKTYEARINQNQLAVSKRREQRNMSKALITCTTVSSIQEQKIVS